MFFSLQDLVHSFDRRFLYSTATLQVSPGSKRKPQEIDTAEFFASSSNSSYVSTSAWVKSGNSTLTAGGIEMGKKKASFQNWLEILPTYR